jgi:phosphohistidine phosphatase
MAIFLIQHGKSLSKDQDPDQGLSAQGMDDVKRIAAVAQGYGVRVGSIVHSGKKRARQTAEILATALRPAGGVTEMEGLGPLDDVVSFAGGLDAQSHLMVVGHLPFMERLTSFLITGNVDRPVFRFQNGGIVCLDQGPCGTGWVIKWTLMPQIG